MAANYWTGHQYDHWQRYEKKSTIPGNNGCMTNRRLLPIMLGTTQANV